MRDAWCVFKLALSWWWGYIRISRIKIVMKSYNSGPCARRGAKLLCHWLKAIIDICKSWDVLHYTDIITRRLPCCEMYPVSSTTASQPRRHLQPRAAGTLSDDLSRVQGRQHFLSRFLNDQSKEPLWLRCWQDPYRKHWHTHGHPDAIIVSQIEIVEARLGLSNLQASPNSTHNGSKST